MKTFVLPNDLIDANQDQDLFFFNYKTSSESEKSKVIFKKNIINFLISGNKVIHTLDKEVSIRDTHGLLVRSGNCLTTEKILENNQFQALIFYFDSKYIQEFMVKYSKVVSSIHTSVSNCDSDIFVFEKDEFIKNYIDSVLVLFKTYTSIPFEFIKLKFEEIMLHLVRKNGASFLAFVNNMLTDASEIDFKATIESESMNVFTLDEIAFLCNMSLSTFKRHFTRTFDEPPQKWFQKKRMQYAYDSIKCNNKKASDLYLDLGYNSLSSFSVAFSKIFGVPPTKVNELNN